MKPTPEETQSQERHSMDHLIEPPQPEYLEATNDQTAAKKPLRTPEPTPPQTHGKGNKLKVPRKKDPMYDSVDRRDSRYSVITGPRSRDPNNRKLDKAMLDNIRRNRLDDERDAFNNLKGKNARRLLETEDIIRGTLELLDTDPWDDLGNW